MIEEVKKVKKVKDPKIESQKIIDNHQKAAMHHEAAKHHSAGNTIMACGCNTKAKDQSDLAKKVQKKNKKKHALIA